MWYFWFKIGIAGIVAGGVAAKALGEVSRRAAARKRMAAGQRELDDAALVTMTGTVHAIGEPIVAPASGTPCVAHLTRVRVKGRATRRAKIERQEIVRVELVPFRLETTDGDVIVDGTTADLAIRPRAIVPRRIEHEARFLRTLQITIPPDSIELDEVVIEPGARITVHGIARIEVTPGEAGFREVPTQKKLVGDDHHPITICE